MVFNQKRYEKVKTELKNFDFITFSDIFVFISITSRLENMEKERTEFLRKCYLS